MDPEQGASCDYLEKLDRVFLDVDINLVRKAPRPLEGDELLNKDIKGNGRSTGLLLPNIITVSNIDRFAIQLLLPDNKDEVVLSNFSVTDLLLKCVFSIVDVSPETSG